MAALTTIAAGVSIAATAASTTASFAQASKQKGLQKEAERKAEEAMAAAKKKLDVNFYDQQGIKKEPYELQREALLSQGAEAIRAGVESERGAGAVAGRVQMAQNDAQAGIRTAMGAEMTALENKQLAEDSRLRDAKVNLDLGEVAGAQLAARDAQKLQVAAETQGWQGVTSFTKELSTLAPLYAQSGVPDASGNRPANYALPENNPTLTNTIAPTNNVVNPFANVAGSINPFKIG